MCVCVHQIPLSVPVKCNQWNSHRTSFHYHISFRIFGRRVRAVISHTVFSQSYCAIVSGCPGWHRGRGEEKERRGERKSRRWLLAAKKANERKRFPSGWTQTLQADIQTCPGHRQSPKAAARQHSKNTVATKEAEGLWGIHKNALALHPLLSLSSVFAPPSFSCLCYLTPPMILLEFLFSSLYTLSPPYGFPWVVLSCSFFFLFSSLFTETCRCMQAPANECTLNDSYWNHKQPHPVLGIAVSFLFLSVVPIPPPCLCFVSHK